MEVSRFLTCLLLVTKVLSLTPPPGHMENRNQPGPVGKRVFHLAFPDIKNDLECEVNKSRYVKDKIHEDNKQPNGSNTRAPENQTDKGSGKSNFFRASLPLVEAAKPLESVSALIKPSKHVQPVIDLENRRTWLSLLLLEVVQRDMKDCDLVVGYDEGYIDNITLKEVLKLPNPKQVLIISSADDLLPVEWESGQCTGYLLLLTDPEPIISFGNEYIDSWDYNGRYLFVLPSKEDFQAFADTVKGKKTEHLAAAIKYGDPTEWRIYINQLYYSWTIERLTSWRRNKFTSAVTLFPDKLPNLHGVTLKGVTFEWKPSVFYYRSKNGTVHFRYGIDIGVVETLREVLNFTVDFEEPEDGEYWGREVSPGNWSGMMGKLSRNEVDLGVVDLYVTIIRVNILDYTLPYDSELSCFMARTEPPLPRWQALAFPFQGITWLAFFIGFVVSGPVLYLLGWGSAKCCGKEVKILQSLTSSWLYSLGVHCSEVQDVLPINMSTQIFVVVLWLYTMIFTIAYSTNLMAFLTVAKPPVSMETIRELHASGIEVSGLGKFYGDALASASDPYLQSLASRFQDYNKDEIIFGKVLVGDSVMLQNRPYLEFVAATRFIDHSIPRLRLMRECFAPFSIAMAVQNHSPLKRKFDQIIGWMINGGLIRRFFLDSLRLAASVRAQSELGLDDSNVAGPQVGYREGVIPIGLDHLQGLFYIYIAGCVVSAFTFFLEICFHKGYHTNDHNAE